MKHKITYCNISTKKIIHVTMVESIQDVTDNMYDLFAFLTCFQMFGYRLAIVLQN